MTHYFVNADNHQWAHSKESMFDALQKCQITPPCLTEYYCDAFQDSRNDGDENVLNDYLESAKEGYEIDLTIHKSYDFNLFIMPDEVELNEVSALNGTPIWTLPDSMSEEEFFEQREVYKMTIDHNGRLSLRED